MITRKRALPIAARGGRKALDKMLGLTQRVAAAG
jgi:hypothetical protein